MLPWTYVQLHSQGTAYLWPKDSDAGRDWGQEVKGVTEDEMAGWHDQLDGLEFEWTLGVGDRHVGLECCNSWGCKESDTTEGLNWTELKRTSLLWLFIRTHHAEQHIKDSKKSCHQGIGSELFNQASPNSFNHKKTYSRMCFLTSYRTLQTVSNYKSDHLTLLEDMTGKWINTKRWWF